MEHLILNSRGLNTETGCYQILDKLDDKTLTDKTIFIVSLPEYEVDEKITGNCTKIMGFAKENLYFSAKGIPENLRPDYVYVTEGNTFEVLQYMRDHDIISYIKKAVTEDGTVYIGSSAGALIAGTDIKIAGIFESNFVGMYDYTALEFFDGTVIPHFEKYQLEELLESSQDTVFNRYTNIHSVSNTEVLIIKNGKIVE